MLKIIKILCTLPLLFLVFFSAAQTMQDFNHKKPVIKTVRLAGSSAQDSLHYLVHGNIFDTTGVTGLHRAHIIVSGSGSPMDADTVSAFTDEKGAFRLWVPERLRKYSILYIAVHPIGGYKSLQFISFLTNQLPYKLLAAPPLEEIKVMHGCRGVRWSNIVQQ